MSRYFNRKDLPEVALTFDDVLLVPNKSTMRSRRDPILSTRITKNITKNLPVISANMDTITEKEMVIAIDQMGGFGILHRFMSIQDQVDQVKEIIAAGVKEFSASIGVQEQDWERAEALVEYGVPVLTVDIAHGHSMAMLEVIEKIKNKWSHIEVIAGNVATPQGTADLINAGADSIKVGIGPGSMCTTRVITGCGMPQLTAVAMCSLEADKYDIPVIADGGIKTSGDIVKALSAGASCVMLGSLLSGTLETPGLIEKGHKLYRGMASKSAQASWRGGVPKGMAAEGESTRIPVKGPVSQVVEELMGGLRSGMTYLNATTISEIRENANFMRMTSAGFSESRAHGLNY
jgi:IMP dehydrogenase